LGVFISLEIITFPLLFFLLFNHLLLHLFYVLDLGPSALRHFCSPYQRTIHSSQKVRNSAPTNDSEG
jgi:hypothetical protein